jgi:hypothetical protein
MTIFINHSLCGLLIFSIWDQGVTIRPSFKEKEKEE